MQIVMISGNIGRDAEVRQAGSESVCSFNVACNRKVKGQDVTTWFSCSLWGKRGEALSKHLTKGKRVSIVGELSTREKDGKTYLEVRVSELDFAGGAKGERAGGSDAAGNSGAYPDSEYGADDKGDALPF